MNNQISDLNLRLEDAVSQVNTMVEEIAELNEVITRKEADGSTANDLRDKRDVLLRNLAELIEMNQFEDPRDGSVTVLTPKGFPLIEGNTYWTLSTGKDSAGNVRIYWDRTPDAHIDMTDTFDQGQLGGLVGIRTAMEGFLDQFDEFAAMLIKEVNRQHSQGVGLVHMTDAVGTYEISPFARLETDLSGENNDIVFTAKTAGLPGDQITVTYIDPGGINQPFGLTVTGNDIVITLGRDATGSITTTAEDIVEFINNDSSAEAQAARALVSVALAEDNDGKGIVGAMNTTNLNRYLSNLLEFGEDLAAGSFDLLIYDASGTPTFNTINVNPDDTREDIIAQIGETFTDGIQGVRASIFTDDAGKEHIRIEADTGNGYEYAFANDTASILMALGINTFFAGCDTTNIQVNEAVQNDLSLINAGLVAADGQTPPGSNVNALDIADLKDQTFLFQHGTSTISEAYNTLAADIGSTARNIYRNTEFTENLVMQLEQQRDSISAVSLDEELTNMIKFQYAYMAAARIVSVSDEMLQSLISMV
ncbi:MAG: hypothetical protein JRI34_07200 [Deltaproteobacteria bacterium]|nr:hypothetical protein [Deltaproteobacteria bacterium]